MNKNPKKNKKNEKRIMKMKRKKKKNFFFLVFESERQVQIFTAFFKYDKRIRLFSSRKMNSKQRFQGRLVIAWLES